MKTIQLNHVLSEVNAPNAVFDIKYRKDDGTVGEKKRVMKRVGNNGLNDHKKMNRLGLLKIWNPKTGEDRDITIDLIVEFNGKRVIRNYDE